MRGVLIPTDGRPTIVSIRPDEAGSTLHDLQRLVGGNIEAFPVLFGEGIDLYVNEDGLSICPPNRAIYATREMEEAGYLSQMDFAHVAKEGELYTILFGDIVAVGFDPETGGSRDLTLNEIDEVTDYFTNVSGPASGLMEVLAIRLGMHRDGPEREGHVTLREAEEAARGSAERLAEEHGPDAPERGKNGR